jgi:DNA-binding CsgD family transcriptional regulator
MARSTLSARQYIMHRLSAYGLDIFIGKMQTIAKRDSEILIMSDFDLSQQEDIGDKFELSSTMVDQIARKTRQRVRNELFKMSGFRDEIEKLEKEVRLLRYKLEKANNVIREQNRPVPTTEEIDALKIEDLGMSVRLYNSIKANKINSVGDLKEVGNECLEWRSFGKKSYEELAEILDGVKVQWPLKDKRLF